MMDDIHLLYGISLNHNQNILSEDEEINGIIGQNIGRSE
jgi:hypothetical protein